MRVEITRPAHKGQGIGQAPDGRVIFVSQTAPGDVVEVADFTEHKNFLEANSFEIISPAPGRIPVSCPAAAAGAGCCDFSFLDIAAQREIKKQVLADSLRRIGRFEGVEIELRELSPVTHWRTRARFVVTDGALAQRAKNSHELVYAHCTQMHEALYEYAGPDGEVTLAVDDSGQVHAGADQLIRRIGAYEFKGKAEDFWQSHLAAPTVFNEIIAELLEGRKVTTAWDLYGGAGALIPSLLASGARQVHSVDIGGTPGNFGAQVQFHRAKVEQWVRRRKAKNVDVIVLDPPRVGMHREVSKALGASAKTLVHVGCDPASFARDVRRWVDQGYRLERVILADSFPHTHHFESFALLGV
ncbi:MAG: TRAM domain-containing protein [Corynebacterium sp.]|nr:TRAM domain-containing protein [Corynebacterium sp.]